MTTAMIWCCVFIFWGLSHVDASSGISLVTFFLFNVYKRFFIFVTFFTFLYILYFARIQHNAQYTINTDALT